MKKDALRKVINMVKLGNRVVVGESPYIFQIKRPPPSSLWRVFLGMPTDLTDNVSPRESFFHHRV